jgi:hypothetical protein
MSSDHQNLLDIGVVEHPARLAVVSSPRRRLAAP